MTKTVEGTHYLPGGGKNHGSTINLGMSLVGCLARVPMAGSAARGWSPPMHVAASHGIGRWAFRSFSQRGSASPMLIPYATVSSHILQAASPL